MILRKIISGGQTGADRAGLDAALALGLDVGGWVPKGRITERGPLTDEDMAKYKLQETASYDYFQRTSLNVTDSDGTVIFGNRGSSGSRLTIAIATEQQRPLIVNPSADTLRQFVQKNRIRVLNVAGNRASVNNRVYDYAFTTIIGAFRSQVLTAGQGHDTIVD